MDKWLLAGGINGFVAVAAGAFGAHALKARLPADLLAIFDTGARYHLVHAVMLVAVALLAKVKPAPALDIAGWGFLAGIVLFSGSLYVLALSGVRWLGAITPLGGVAFLLGWATLAWVAAKG